MNKLIFRKLYFDIVAFFLLSSLAITIIVWVIQGVNLLDIISEQGHSFKIYFLYSILNIPKIFSKLIIFDEDKPYLIAFSGKEVIKNKLL